VSITFRHMHYCTCILADEHLGMHISAYERLDPRTIMYKQMKGGAIGSSP